MAFDFDTDGRFVAPQSGSFNFDDDGKFIAQPKQEDATTGNFMRGAKVAWGQTEPLAKGIMGAVGATGEQIFGEGGISTGLKRWGLKGYQDGMDKLQPLQHENDDVTVAWDKAKQGDIGALMDWAAYGLGYGAVQLGESAAIGGIGALAGKAGVQALAKGTVESMVEKQATKIAATDAAAGMTADQITAAATRAVANRIEAIGAGSALQAYNETMEVGSIYPDAVEQAQKEGRQMTGSDLAKVWGWGTLAAATESATDVLGLGAATGRIQMPGFGGRLTRAATGAAIGSGVEGGQEAVQTIMERIGAGQEVFGAEGMRDIINSAAMGALPGGVLGGAAGAIHAPHRSIMGAQNVDEAISAAQESASQPLALPLLAGEDLIAFPDGSVGTRQQAEEKRFSDMIQPAGVPADPIDRARVARVEAERDKLRAISEALATEQQRRDAEEALRREEEDKAFRQRMRQIESAKDQDYSQARQLALAEEVERSNVLTRAQGFDDHLPTAMELAFANALKSSAETTSSTPSQRTPQGEDIQALPQTPQMLSLARNGKGTLVISGNADDVLSSEEVIRTALPGVPVMRRNDHDGGVSLAIGRTASQDHVQVVVDRMNAEARRGNQVENAEVAEKGAPGQRDELPGGRTSAQVPVGDRGQMVVPSQPERSSRTAEPVLAFGGEKAALNGLSLGVSPSSAEPVTVRQGVVYIGDYPAQHSDTGEDVVVPDGATPQQIKAALQESGAMGKRQRLFGAGPAEQLTTEEKAVAEEVGATLPAGVEIDEPTSEDLAALGFNEQEVSYEAEGLAAGDENAGREGAEEGTLRAEDERAETGGGLAQPVAERERVAEESVREQERAVAREEESEGIPETGRSAENRQEQQETAGDVGVTSERQKSLALESRQQKEQPRNLFAMHNMTAENILHADRLGGLAVPSIAIAKKESPIEGFGEITLLGDKSLIDPRSGAKVFGSDVYSPRYPEIKFKLDSASLKKLNEALKPYRESGEREIYGGEIERLDDLTSNYAFRRYVEETKEESYNYGVMKSAAEDLLRQSGADEKIFQGYTYSGNRRYVPHTLETVVRILKKEIRGGEGFNYGVGSVRSKYTPQFRSVEQIKKSSDRLVDKATFAKLKDEIDNEFFTVAKDLEPYHPASDRFGFGDTVSMMMADAATRGIPSAMEENGFKDVPVEAMEEVRDFLNKLRTLPTEYFEAKLLRAVRLSEFSGAAVPDNVDPRVLDVLRKNGINDIRTYKKNDMADRTAKINEFQNLLFSKTSMQDGTSADAEAQVPKVEDWIADARTKLKNIPDVRVVADQREVPYLSERMRSLAQKFMREGDQKSLETLRDYEDRPLEGAYSDGAIWLVAGSLPTKERALQVLAHEAVGHMSVLQMLESAESGLVDRLVENVQRLDRLGQKYIRELAAAVDRSQPGLDAASRAKEIIAQIAERGDQGKDIMGSARTVWQRIMDGIRAFFNLTFGIDLSEQDVVDIVGMAERWAQGDEHVTATVNGVRDSLPLSSRRAEAEFRSRGFPREAGNIISDYRSDADIKSHPEYKAAKGGDIDAAIHLVQDMVKPESIERARERFGSDVVYVPVHAEEASGKNKIPVALAARYAAETGGDMATDIVQANRAYHTGADAMQRLLARAEFDGPVEVGRRYVLVDDVSTMGSTLADLANYIQSKGGKVAGAVTLANSSRSGMMRPDSSHVRTVEERHGEQLRQDFRIYPSALTFDEARYLAGFRSSEELRNRAAKARLERVGRLREKGVSEVEITSGPPSEGRGASGGLESRSVVTGNSGRLYTPQQISTFERTGRTVKIPSMKERIASYTENWSMKLKQGIADQFAPLEQLDKHAYIQARLSKAYDGAVEALMLHGKVYLDGGIYNADKSGGVLDRLMRPLGKEVDDFMWWVAAKRAERLAGEDREHLFTPDDIAAYKALGTGKTDFDYTLSNGKTTRSRELIYHDAAKVLDEFNKSILDIAEQSGLIDGESRSIWEHEFYVPFYRAIEDEEVGGPGIKSGLVRQKAFQKLKGGSEALNHDLIANVLQNWSHLLAASAKNRAAASSLQAAKRVGVAEEVPSGTKGSVFYLDKGKQKHFLVSDPFLMNAISALDFGGFKGPVMKVMGKFKHYLTLGVTANPAFKVRNLIRDSIAAIGQSDLSVNPLENIRQGFKATDKKSQTYVSMLASGGIVKFGTMLEGNRADHVRQLIEEGVSADTILDNESKIKYAYRRYIKPAIEAYNELGDRGESINRAALYEQMIASGMSHEEASYAARDLLDFSMGGTWQAVRLLTQVVPFMNARIQGLYKLGRADKKRLGYVVGAVSLASLALLCAYGDDDDWKKREDWDRDNYWWFKFGGVAFRIPKPFEIGAIGTLAERSAELFFDKEMDSRRYFDRLQSIVGNQLQMNPIPQVFKPIIDIYANKDSFSGRPIETMGMEKMRTEDRFNANSSEVAKILGKANVLSPVQIDQAIRGYFGWLGTSTTGAIDYMARSVSDVPRPEMQLRDVFLAGNFLETLPANSSRYVTQMYDQAKEIEEVWQSLQHYRKMGETEKAQQILEENRDKLGRYRAVEAVKRSESAINLKMQRVQESKSLSPEAKRHLLDQLSAQRDRIARRLSP